MRDLGPETPADRSLREWFDEQERTNLTRLEEGAKTITQLTTGLYGVLFAILAFSANPTPAYLRDPVVHWLGTIGLIALFLALLAALVTGYPTRSVIEADNLSSMRRALASMRQRKLWSLRAALWLFLIGMGSLGILIGWVLWSFV
jgi:hypothetical protein